jgi:hypothetical protein
VSKARILGAKLKGIVVDNSRKRIIYCGLFALKDLCPDSAASLDTDMACHPEETE